MSNPTTVSQEHQQSNVTTLKEEVSVLEIQIALLEKEQSQSPFWLRLLRNWFRFGHVKKLEWTRFKLHLKQKDLLAVTKPS